MNQLPQTCHAARAPPPLVLEFVKNEPTSRFFHCRYKPISFKTHFFRFNMFNLISRGTNSWAYTYIRIQSDYWQHSTTTWQAQVPITSETRYLEKRWWERKQSTSSFFICPPRCVYVCVYASMIMFPHPFWLKSVASICIFENLIHSPHILHLAQHDVGTHVVWLGARSI